MGPGEKCLLAQRTRTRLRCTALPKHGCRHPLRKKPEEREFVADSGASNMLSNKGFSSAELETLRNSRNPTTVITANGEVQTNEEAQIHVHDLVIVQLLEDTPAVLSFGQLCEEHVDTNEWASGQKPHLTKNGTSILCSTENVVPIVVPGLSWSSSASSSSAPFPRHRVPPRVQQDYEVTILSQASGDRGDPHQTLNHNINKDNQGAAENRVRDLSEITDTLEDAEVPAVANTSHDSDSERPTKVESRKHSIYTHFTKDRNCEVCKRTKVTRAPCRKRTGETVLRADNFGDLITASHTSHQWGRWISKQSPIWSRGGRFGNSMDSILSV